MANERVSELDEQLNPVDTDIVEVSNYTGVADPETGSLYQSLFLSLLNLYTYIKNKLKADGSIHKITTYTFTAADYWTFEPTQYEMVLYINARFTTATTIKVGTLTDPEAYIAETSNTSSSVGIYCDSANVSDRSINIALNGSGIVTVISIKNV